MKKFEFKKMNKKASGLAIQTPPQAAIKPKQWRPMSKDRKRLYEGMFILSASLSNDSRQKALDKVTDSISQKGGKIEKIHDQGRRKLCYEIKGKKEGHYYLIYFTSPTLAISEAWKDFHLHEDLLRFMTMQADEVVESLDFKPIKAQG